VTASPSGHVVVLGGGIGGLAAAHALGRDDGNNPPPRLTLVEAGDRLGGKLRTETFRGRPFDVGADAFLARVPGATELCQEIGLGDELEAPASGRVHVWSRGRLRPLPEGLVLGVPARLLPLARSGLLSPAGLARAALDLVLPPSSFPDGDPTVGTLVGARFGREVVERLVDPLLSGVYAGDVDRLSAAATVPDLAAAAHAHRSLLLGLRARRQVGTGGEDENGGSPLFYGVRDGMEQLVTRLVEHTPSLDVVLGDGAVRVTRAGAGYHVRLASGRELEADAVVVAVPAFAAADLLAGEWPDAAAELRAVEYASAAVVALAYERAAVDRPLDGSGFLVPRVEGRLVKACTWSSSKWPRLAGGDDVLLRCSVGRAGDDTALDMGDDELVGRVHAELARVMSLRAAPLESRVVRWERALPQYPPGHLDRVRRLDASLAGNPGLALVGAAYEGVGLPAVIRRAEAVARRLRSVVTGG
jgi:oxygen-dependent protoporphyrinogen oxidase